MSPTPPRTYTRKELCQLYKISPSTFKRWLELLKDKMDIAHRRIFTIAEVEMIFGRFGSPLGKQEELRG